MNFERKRVVFDTSALIGVLTKPEGICNDALIIGVEQCRLLASEETLAEFVFVARRDKFDKYASRAEREYILTQYAKRVEKVTISVESTDCRDPKDNKFLSLALSGDADMIVTGDDDLLVLHPYKGIAILTIRDFVDRYRDESV